METISQVKLREIQKQRKRLLELFDIVSKDVKDAPSLQKKLEILLEGIIKKKHTLGESAYVTSGDIHHLNVLLKQSHFGNVSADLLASWVAKLEKEIHFGRSQTEFAYIFGCVLQEWAAKGSQDSSNHDDDDDNAEDLEDLLSSAKEAGGLPRMSREDFLRRVEKIWTQDKRSVDTSLLDGIAQRENLGKFVNFATMESTLIAKVSSEEIKAASSALCGDNLVGRDVKKVLTTLQTNEVLCNEYAGVVTIMLKNLSEWGWPSSLKLKILLNKNLKWRVFVDEDIVTALFLQVIGARWGSLLKNQIQSYWRSIRNENSWTADYTLNQSLNKVSAATLPSSSVDTSNQGDYGAPRRTTNRWGQPEVPLKQSVIQILASVTKSARDQIQDLAFVATDVENFYMSISHEVVLHLLKLYNCPSNWIDFVAKFLTPEVILDEVLTTPQQPAPAAGGSKKKKGGKQDPAPAAQPSPAAAAPGGGAKNSGKIRQGLLTGHAISKVLHELLMLHFDVHGGKEVNHHLVRNFDDIYFWSSSEEDAVKCWKSLNTFMGKIGMNLNAKTTGSCVVTSADFPPLSLSSAAAAAAAAADATAAETKNKLPKGKVIYGLLELTEAGHWIPWKEEVAMIRSRFERKLSKCQTIFAWVKHYNAGIKHLLLLLSSPGYGLGIEHVKGVCNIMSEIHNKIEGKGVIRFLQGELDKRFKERNLGVKIPEAWYYWPITAGGLGVYNPIINLSVLYLLIQGAEEKGLYKVTGEREEDQNTLQTLQRVLEPTAPASTTELNGRIGDFTRRGGNVRGNHQSNLGVYWKWLLCNYGDQIIDTVGTLEFTDPELVPVALIQGIDEMSD